MKTYIKFIAMLFLLLFSQSASPQISGLIPDSHMGGNAATLIENWQESGSSVITNFTNTNETIFINHYFDASEDYNIYPNGSDVGTEINSMINDLTTNFNSEDWKLVYFQSGTYNIEVPIIVNSASKIIFKGAGGSRHLAEFSELIFDFSADYDHDCITVQSSYKIGFEDFIIEDITEYTSKTTKSNNNSDLKVNLWQVKHSTNLAA